MTDRKETAARRDNFLIEQHKPETGIAEGPQQLRTGRAEL
jgi:hypothetical protein